MARAPASPAILVDQVRQTHRRRWLDGLEIVERAGTGRWLAHEHDDLRGAYGNLVGQLDHVIVADLHRELDRRLHCPRAYASAVEYADGWTIVDASSGGRIADEVLGALYEALESRRVSQARLGLLDGRALAVAVGAASAGRWSCGSCPSPS